MVGFYDSSYQRVKTLERYRSTAFFSLFFCLVCLIMAWAPVPSPLGAELGNDLALACVGASLSVAMVAVLDCRNVRNEMLGDCWKAAIRLHDNARSATWYNEVPYYAGGEKAAAVIEEQGDLRLPGLGKGEPALNEYMGLRREHDSIFSTLDSDEQRQEALKDVSKWIASTKEPIAEYARLAGAAQSFSELRGEIESLSHPKAKRLFLKIFDLSERVKRTLDFELDGTLYPFLSNGWGSPSLDYRGLLHCKDTIGKVVEREIDGKKYQGDEFQLEIYNLLNELLKLHLTVRPNDKETRSPWGGSIVELP